MKAKLQRYLQKTFGIRLPYGINNINYTFSIGGKFHIRFELGGELTNGTKERVKYATQRAITLFEETFDNREEDVWILVYEHPGDSLFGRTSGFLRQQFSAAQYSGFYKKIEIAYIESREKCKVKIIIGKIKIKHLKYEGILAAIANAEMGFKPKFSDTIFFIGTKNSRIFHMYDDRGCFVEGNTVDSIKNLYAKRNEWIADYHRPEIDKQFR